jgi:hypothetical protein
MIRRHAAAIVTAFLVPVALGAQLAFEQTEIRVELDFGAERVSRDFVFTNNGDFPVEILEVRSSCGCTTAALDKHVYEPGESGTITAEFDVGQRVGEQSNSIMVRTDDAERSIHSLVLFVDIPRALTLSHRFLIWQRDADPDTRRVEVVFHPNAPYRLEGVEVEGDAFRVELTKDDDVEGRYYLDVTPLDLSESDRAAIVLRTEPEPSTPRAFSLYAYVR